MFKKKLLLAVILLLTVHTRAFANEDPVIIRLKAITGLQFDLARFSVKPGAKVKLILTNSDDMVHNLIITLPGERQNVVDAALKLGDKGPKLSYIPGHKAVLWSIPSLEPGESRSVTFTVPKKEGIYPYVCTYPGHGFAMFGAMYVREGALPALKDDPNIPPMRRAAVRKSSKSEHAGHTGPAHPYKETPPYLYRTFIDKAGPATIAVRLPQNLAYFWDAGACRLRYASEGDFLDMKELWAGHRQAVANNLGTVFFRDKTEYPLRTGSIGNIPEVKFKGYRLIERYPEFHYQINGTSVFELIKQKPDGTGLVRTFRIPEAKQSVWFVVAPGDGVKYAASAGKWSAGKLELTAAEAKNFTITMTKKEGGLL